MLGLRSKFIIILYTCIIKYLRIVQIVRTDPKYMIYRVTLIFRLSILQLTVLQDVQFNLKFNLKRRNNFGNFNDFKQYEKN